MCYSIAGVLRYTLGVDLGTELDAVAPAPSKRRHEERREGAKRLVCRGHQNRMRSRTYSEVIIYLDLEKIALSRE